MRLLLALLVALLTPTWGQANPTAAFTIVKNPTAHVAPCAVTVYANPGTDLDPDYTRDFHSLRAYWHFGDSNTGLTWSVSRASADAPWGANRNRATGMVAAHQYRSAGTFTITLTLVANDGATSQAQQSVTCADADTYFSGTNTVCIATASTPTAGADGCPSGAAVVNAAGDFDAAITGASCDADSAKRRCLLRRGETFTASARVVGLANDLNQGMIGVYGAGSDTAIINIATDTGVFDIDDAWTLSELTITETVVGTKQIGSSLIESISNEQIRYAQLDRVTVGPIDSFGPGVQADGACWSLRQGNHAADPDIGNMIIDSRCLVDGAHNILTYYNGQEALAYLGNEVNVTGAITGGDCTHIQRSEGWLLSVVSHNKHVHNTTCGDYGPWQIRGFSGAMEGDPQQYNWFSFNETVNNASSGNSAEFGRVCEDGSCDPTTGGPVRDFVFEQNLFSVPTTTLRPTGFPGFEFQGGESTWRQNVFDLPGALTGPVTAVAQNAGSSDATVHDNMEFTGNAIYTTSDHGAIQGMAVGAGTGHRAQNNLSYTSGDAGTPDWCAGSGCTENGNLDASSNPFVASVPSAGTARPRDFQIPTGSSAKDVGTDISADTDRAVTRDFGFGVQPNGSYDAGAWEFGAVDGLPVFGGQIRGVIIRGGVLR